MALIRVPAFLVSTGTPTANVARSNAPGTISQESGMVLTPVLARVDTIGTPRQKHAHRVLPAMDSMLLEQVMELTRVPVSVGSAGAQSP